MLSNSNNNSNNISINNNSDNNINNKQIIVQKKSPLNLSIISYNRLRSFCES